MPLGCAYDKLSLSLSLSPLSRALSLVSLSRSLSRLSLALSLSPLGSAYDKLRKRMRLLHPVLDNIMVQASSLCPPPPPPLSPPPLSLRPLPPLTHLPSLLSHTSLPRDSFPLCYAKRGSEVLLLKVVAGTCR
jgi:hypothetical protein